MNLLCLTHRITLSELRPMNVFLSIVRIWILSWTSLENKENKIQWKQHHFFFFALLWTFQCIMIFQTCCSLLYSVWGVLLCKGWQHKLLRHLTICREQTFLVNKKKVGAKHFQTLVLHPPRACLPGWFKPLKCTQPWVLQPWCGWNWPSRKSVIH